LHDEDCELHTGYEQEKVKPFQNSRNPRSRHQASNLNQNFNDYYDEELMVANLLYNEP